MCVAILRIIRASIPAFLLFAATGVSLTASEIGFIPNRVYDGGPTDSIDLFSLNPIVSQSLSPVLSVGDTLRLSAAASYGGFSWGRGVDPVTGQYSILYLGVSTGVMGAGWRFGPGRIWKYETHDTTWHCDAVQSLFVGPDGGDHLLELAEHRTKDGSRLSDIVGPNPPGPPQPCSISVPPLRSIPDHYVTTLQSGFDYTEMTFNPVTGALMSQNDVRGNNLTWSYMEPFDFQALGATSPAQYNFDTHDRWFPGTHQYAIEMIKIPRSVEDSMGRRIEFRYGMITGWPKFLLTEVHVPAPNGTAIYRLQYQIRSITSPPPGWPPFTPASSTAIPFLVEVQLPSAGPGAASLNYQYDYTAWGELSEIRYPTGARTVLTWDDVTLIDSSVRRGVVARGICPDPAATSACNQWRYEKTSYPMNAGITDRDRTIVTDPAGNETEYRFFAGFPSLTGAPGAIRYYRGGAPRYLPNATSLSQYVVPYTGKLMRVVTWYYRGNPTQGQGTLDETESLRRVERTTFYDDPLKPPARNVDDPGVWFADELNVEIRDPLQFNVNEAARPEGFAWFQIAGAFHAYNRTMIPMPFPAWNDTTESGNLVGHPRRIQGRYNGNVPRWVERTPELITQESEIPGRAASVTRTDFGDAVLGPFGYTVIRRADPSMVLPAPGEIWTTPEPQPFDVVTRYIDANATAFPAPVARGSLGRVEYSGGGTTNAVVAADTGVAAATEHMTNEYGALARSSFGTLTWLGTDVEVGPTGLANLTRDSAGIETTRQYDNLGRLTAIIPRNPELSTGIGYGTSSAIWYDTRGNQRIHRYSNRVTVSRGAEGEADQIWSEQTYDGLGHVTMTRRLTATGDRVQQTRTYNGLGSPTFVSEWHLPDDFHPAPPPPGTQISYAVSGSYGVNGSFSEPFSRPTRLTTADGSTTDIEYFGMNSRVTINGLNGVPGQSSTTTYYRDYRNRLRIVDAPEGADAIYYYDATDNLIRVRLVAQVHLSAYDANPAIPSLNTNRFSVMNPESEGQVREFNYNALGNLVTATHPEKGTTTYLSYDARGNLLLMRDAGGTEFRYTYDDAGRLTLTETKNASESIFRKLTETTYKNSDDDDPGGSHGAAALGRPIRMSEFGPQGLNALSIRDQIYDGLNGRLSAERSTFLNWLTGPDPQIETSYTYDDFGRVSGMVYPAPQNAGSVQTPTRLSYHYTHGFLTRLDTNRQSSDPLAMTPLIGAVTYTLAGDLRSMTLANGVIETTEPDIQQRPARITATSGTRILWDSGLYEYDGASNLIAVGGEQFTYDEVGRLTSASIRSPATANLSYQQQYAYDLFGNMTFRRGAAGQAGDQLFAVDTATNRLTSLNLSALNLEYVHDALGSVTNDGRNSYHWDRAGRLDQVRTVDDSVIIASYNYDDRGYRFRVTTDGGARQTFYLRDESGRVLAEYARPSSSAEPQWSKDYVYALGRHIAVVENTEPATPARVISSADAGHVTLHWSDVTSSDLFGYDVYRAASDLPDSFIRLTPAPLTTASWTSAQASGETYRYRIGAVDDSGMTGALTAPVRLMVGDVTPPPAPAGFTGSELFACSIGLSWEPVTRDTRDESDILGYDLYRRVAGDLAWPAAPRNGALPIETGQYVDTVSPGDGRSFEYGVVTVDAAGRRSAMTILVVRTKLCAAGGTGGRGRIHPVYDVASSGPVSSSLLTGGSSMPATRIRYFHVDHLGTPRVITDEAGSIVASAAFFPFGEIVPGSTTAGNTHWFTGHERDFSSNLDYMLGRETSLATGRFLSADSTLGNSSFGRPLSWDLYSYADDTPLVTVDPDGLASIRRRGLTILPNCGATPNALVPDSFHEQIFYNDGKQPGNSGFFSDGKVRADDPANLPYYWMINDNIDDSMVRRAEANVQARGLGSYSLTSNNCQDYITLVMAEFSRISRGERLLKDCKKGKVESCRILRAECAAGKLTPDLCAEYEKEKSQGNLPAHMRVPTSLDRLRFED